MHSHSPSTIVVLAVYRKRVPQKLNVSVGEQLPQLFAPLHRENMYQGLQGLARWKP